MEKILNDEICTGQAEQVIVVNCLQLAVDLEGDHDEDIAHDGDQTHHRRDGCDGDDLPQPMAFQRLVTHWGAVGSGRCIVVRFPFHPGARVYIRVLGSRRFSLLYPTSSGQHLEERESH